MFVRALQCAEPPKTKASHTSLGTTVRDCVSCLQACYAKHGACGGFQCVDLADFEAAAMPGQLAGPSALPGITSAGAPPPLEAPSYGILMPRPR